jgi:DNA polymerase III subunit alpha
MNIPVTGFEHLHLHTDFSLLDGFGMVEEYAQNWKNKGRFLCVSDHGMMGAVPRQISACEKVCDELKDKNALSPIFACELYINRFHTEATPDAASRDKFVNSLNEEEKKGFRVRGAHLLAIAYSPEGYTNLIRLTTWAYLNGFYGKPRVNYEQLLKHKEGLIFTSCCYNSEIGKAFEYGGESWEEKRDAAAEVVERYMAMFGDKFYLEIMMLDFKKQKPYDRFILWAADKYGLPIILSQDTHYCLPEDSKFQQLMLMQQTGRTVLDIQKAMDEEGIKDLFELQDKQLWQKSEEELNTFYLANYSDAIPIDIYQQAKRNTVNICEMCKGVKLDRRNKLPKLPDADARLQEYINRGFRERHISGQEYKRRAAIEFELICRKGFSSYFIIQKKMVDEARRYYREDLKLGTGYEAVGPGRGSAVGALTCYLLGITDVDPVEEDLLFDRFLSDSRGGRQIKLRFSIDPLPAHEEGAD